METQGFGVYSSLFLTPKLPHSPHRSGTATPPLQMLVSVPFKWEEEPGKPRLCTALIALPEPEVKFLELPPCRMPLIMESTEKITKTPSPTAVLDGPCNLARPKFSSFRFFRDNHDSFDSYSSASPDSALDDIWIGKKSSGRRTSSGFLSRTTLKWRGGKEEFGGDVVGFSPSSIAGRGSDTESCKKVKMEGKLRRTGSISRVSDARSTTHNYLWACSTEIKLKKLFNMTKASRKMTLWRRLGGPDQSATIYEGIKQVIPWKSAKKSQK